MLAPHGRRAPECFENPAYSQELGCGDRASPAFYDTVRRIHAGLAAASAKQSGEIYYVWIDSMPA